MSDRPLSAHSYGFLPWTNSNYSSFAAASVWIPGPSVRTSFSSFTETLESLLSSQSLCISVLLTEDLCRLWSAAPAALYQQVTGVWNLISLHNLIMQNENGEKKNQPQLRYLNTGRWLGERLIVAASGKQSRIKTHGGATKQTAGKIGLDFLLTGQWLLPISFLFHCQQTPHTHTVYLSICAIVSIS